MPDDAERGAWRQLAATFFGAAWPMWVGGLVLGLLNICLLLVKYPWGGSGSYINWGQNLYQALGFQSSFIVLPVTAHHLGLLGLMTVLGAFAAALLSREFAIRVPPAGEMLKGAVGGFLMGLGCTLGIGCTVGGFLSGVPALSAGAITLALGFALGCWLALRYLLWEMEALPGMSMGRSFMWLAAGKGRAGGWQPALGALVVVGLLVATTHAYRDDPVLTWFAIIGLMLGVVNQRSRFCVTRAFREPFMTGESEAPVAVMVALVVGLLGFTVIKYMGAGAATAGAARVVALKSVYPHFWLKSLIGGTLFGVGMTLAGGCAVGTLWRTGEGQVKLWFSAAAYLLTAPLSKEFLAPRFTAALPAWAQQQVFLPDVVGYGGAVAGLLLLICLWYVFAKWNERTGRFSAT